MRALVTTTLPRNSCYRFKGVLQDDVQSRESSGLGVRITKRQHSIDERNSAVAARDREWAVYVTGQAHGARATAAPVVWERVL